ncbi:MAG TPA: hypothetical protein VJ483_06195 [Holophagaceae bacterium]|nr:hypothetical protein [Holophagaceae bacterium]
MTQQPPLAIRLDTEGECPHCGRPLLTLAQDRCDGCGLSIADVFETLPSVASRLEEIAPGWTVERLKAWAAPRPAQLASAYRSRQWKNLGWWADEELWEHWARMEMSLRGRGKGLQLDKVDVTHVQVAGLGQSHAAVDLRITGTREAFLYYPESGMRVRHTEEDFPTFQELWTLRPTGTVWPSELPPCASCGAGLPFEAAACEHCRTPVDPKPGPWKVTQVWPLDVRGEVIPPRPGSGGGLFDYMVDALLRD